MWVYCNLTAQKQQQKKKPHISFMRDTSNFLQLIVLIILCSKQIKDIESFMLSSVLKVFIKKIWKKIVKNSNFSCFETSVDMNF